MDLYCGECDDEAYKQLYSRLKEFRKNLDNRYDPKKMPITIYAGVASVLDALDEFIKNG